MNTIPDGTLPDLVFYYSLSNPLTKINKTINGTDILQTANGIITTQQNTMISINDIEQIKNKTDITEFYNLGIIGKFAFNIIIYDGAGQNFINLYQVTGTNVYFLPQGTISHSINLNFEKGPDGKFVVPFGQTNVFQILSGSGDFLNATGFIVQITKENLEREVQVYFVKN